MRVLPAIIASCSLALLAGGCATSTPEPELLVLGPAATAQAEAGTLVVDLQDGTTLEAAREATGLHLEWANELSADEALAVVEVPDLAAAQAALTGTPLVEVAEPSMEFHATGFLPSMRFPDDPMYDKQWNFEMVGAKRGWRAGGGRGVKVAVIDTGVSVVADLEGTTVSKGATFVPLTRSAKDDHGHGTHVAGTIAQTTHNGLGVAGIAPEVEIIPLKALAAYGGGRSEWIAAAIDEAVDQGADVINMSLGGSRSAVIENAVDKAMAAGVVVVAAAGNSGREGISSPASVPGVIAVSATGPGDELAPYSSWGKGVIISAPGGDKRTAGGGILQDTIDGKSHAFKEFQGTSMATPHVAGAAAVLLSAGAADRRDVGRLLLGTATDRGTDGYDTKYGHGRLDIASAVSTIKLNRGSVLFGLGAAAAWLLAGFAATPRKSAAVAAAAVTAGGIFFLPLLPLPPGAWVDMLSRPLLQWPIAVLGPDLARNPVWLSAALPLLMTFVLGPTRSLGPIVAGVAAGMGTHLIYGAFTGALSPTWLTGAMGTGWLGLNGAICLLCALAIFGVQKVRFASER